MIRILVVTCLLLSSCTTALWAPKYEAVEIEGFYVNPEAGDLIVTSSNTAYIFPIDKDFAHALNLTRRAAFYPKFEDFSVNEVGQVKGVVTLVFIQPDPSHEMLAKLNALGFKKDALAKGLQLSYALNGNMYRVEGEIPLEKLEKKYVVPVAQPRILSETIGRVIATPVTVAYDAVVVVPTTLIVFTAIGLISP